MTGRYRQHHLPVTRSQEGTICAMPVTRSQEGTDGAMPVTRSQDVTGRYRQHHLPCGNQEVCIGKPNIGRGSNLTPSTFHGTRIYPTLCQHGIRRERCTLTCRRYLPNLLGLPVTWSEERRNLAKDLPVTWSKERRNLAKDLPVTRSQEGQHCAKVGLLMRRA